MIGAIVWHLMMLIWLGGLIFGIWWVWPHFERMTLTGDLVVSIVWLLTGTIAWIVAFQLGRVRYWRR